MKSLNIIPRHNLDNYLSIKPGSGDSGNKELGTLSVGSSCSLTSLRISALSSDKRKVFARTIRHAQISLLSVLDLEILVVELAPVNRLSAYPGAVGKISALTLKTIKRRRIIN
jgi:hypothetical protein